MPRYKVCPVFKYTDSSDTTNMQKETFLNAKESVHSNLELTLDFSQPQSNLESLLFLTQSNFEQAVSDTNLINRTESYVLDQTIEESMASNSFAVGDKAVIYLYADDWRVYDNFW